MFSLACGPGAHETSPAQRSRVHRGQECIEVKSAQRSRVHRGQECTEVKNASRMCVHYTE